MAKGWITDKKTVMPIIRRATIRDSETLGTLGPAAYAVAYSHLWDDAVALAAQLQTFSADAFRVLLERESTRIWLAEIDQTAVGFLSMIIGSANPITAEPNGAEIPRIYLLPGSQGRGMGRSLLEVAICEAENEHLDHVWLDVMSSADTALKAYQNWGFSEIGRKEFSRPVRSSLRSMIVLKKTVMSPARA